MKKVLQAQKFLNQENIDGWLLYDFHGMNELAHRFLEIPPTQMTTRRFFYWIPKKGKPIKIVHAIEPAVLDALPGEKKIYNSWQLLEGHVKSVLKGSKTVAMEYSPKNAIPYVSKVDGGTIDLVRSNGVTVVSSALFLPYFTAVMNPKQVKSHFEAAKALDLTAKSTWMWITSQLKKDKKISEYDIQQKIIEFIEKNGCSTDEAPIVGFNAHSADPHYSPSKEKPTILKKGDFILIDLWCKKKALGSVYGDITRVGIAASKPTEEQQNVFQVVRNAQRAVFDLIKKRYQQNKPIAGYEADDASRKVVEKAGFGKYFTHRTGHSIEVSLHGSGAHLDNLEMHDVRPLLPLTCFSVEPGIYLPGKFGVRLEFDIFIHKNGKVEITGGEQDEIVCLL